MIEILAGVFAWLYSVPCGDVGTPACAVSFSVACGPVACALVPFYGAFLVVGTVLCVADKLRRWLTGARE